MKKPLFILILGGIVMINSYEVGATVVTFFTKVSDPTKSENNTPVADRARLDAISIADQTYAASEWGKRIYDPKYKKTNWK